MGFVRGLLELTVVDPQFLQGTLLAILTNFAYGGPRCVHSQRPRAIDSPLTLQTNSMILSMWPVSAFVMILITLSMAELASAYPVAGAMASWAWKVARGGVRGERYWGWVMSGITMGYHVAVVRGPGAPVSVAWVDPWVDSADEPHYGAGVWACGQHGTAQSPGLCARGLAYLVDLPCKRRRLRMNGLNC